VSRGQENTLTCAVKGERHSWLTRGSGGAGPTGHPSKPKPGLPGTPVTPFVAPALRINYGDSGWVLVGWEKGVGPEGFEVYSR